MNNCISTDDNVFAKSSSWKHYRTISNKAIITDDGLFCEVFLVIAMCVNFFIAMILCCDVSQHSYWLLVTDFIVADFLAQLLQLLQLRIVSGFKLLNGVCHLLALAGLRCGIVVT